MWKRIVSIHGGRYRPLFILIQLSIEALIVYAVPSLHSLSEVSFFYWLIIVLTHALYVSVAYRDPGFTRPPPSSPKSSASSTNPPTPLVHEDRMEAIASSNSECPEEFFKYLQESENSRKSLQELSQESRKSDPKPSFSTFLSENKYLPSSPTNNLKASKAFERRSMKPQILQSDDKPNKCEITVFLPIFCLECNNDQPVRARHCRMCGKCVQKYDHHCTWLGNCIGEKNHLRYYTYLSIQTLQIIASLVLLLQSTISNTTNILLYVLIILLTPTGLFSSFLLIFHTLLITRGLTTWECISWKKIRYLGLNKRSPFDFGPLKNAITFCSSSEPRDWSQFHQNP